MTESSKNQFPEEYASPATLLAVVKATPIAEEKRSEAELEVSSVTPTSTPVAQIKPTPVQPEVSVPAPLKPDTQGIPEESTEPMPAHGELPENYFVIYTKNEAVVSGQSRKLPALGFRFMFISALPLLLSGVVLIGWAIMRWLAIVPAIQSGNATPPDTILNGILWSLGALVWNIFVFGFYLSGLSLAGKRRQLEKRGELIWGEVVNASGVQDRGDNLNLTVEYRFQVPHQRRKRYMNGKIREKRNDLHQKTLPSPGTPVALLYLNRKNYEIL